MSGALVGFEHYTPAPEAVDLPEWVLREETLWARINDACQPVAIDEDALAWKLEVTTCVENEVRCWVTVRSNAEGTKAHAWCGSGGAMGGPVFGDRLRLVAADEDHVVYTRVVWLQVVPVGLRGESQRCTGKSLRELERRNDVLPAPAETAADPVISMGNRTCLFVDDFAVEEASLPEPLSLETSWSNSSVPGRYDCTEPCASQPQMQEYLTHVMTVTGRDFLPPRPRGLDLFRTPEACAAFEDPPPSVLAKDLGPSLGLCLR